MCACANRSCGCTKKQNTPTAEYSFGPPTAIAARLAIELFMLVKSGVTVLPQTISIAALAETLQKLLAENGVLKELLNQPQTPDTVVADEYVQITFGPKQAYVLNVPVTADNRAQLATAFERAAEQLRGAAPTCKSLPGQTMLPFCS
jgi:hypothetical protein